MVLDPTDALLAGLAAGPWRHAVLATRDPAGADHLAAFRYVAIVGERPPALAVAIGRGAGGEDLQTDSDIRETQAFVAHLIAPPAAVPLDGRLLAADTIGLGRPVPADGVAALRLPLAPVALECRRVLTLVLADSIVVGEIRRIHLGPDAAALLGFSASR